MGSHPSRSAGEEQEENHVTETTGSECGPTGSDPSSGPSIMPLFRKQSQGSKKKLQHKQYLAREDPSSTYDISECEISDIPAGVFSLIKVMQKEALLVNNNWLTSIKGGGSFKDLYALRILDLHDNELPSLPDELEELVHLQVLNVQNNKLKALPSNLGKLSCLQTLNVKGNKLKDLPESLCDLRCLRTLDVSANKIAALPRALCDVRTLEHVMLDAAHVTFPPSDVCEQGTEAVMRFLCSERGVQYEPPSKFLLQVLEVPKVSIPQSQSRHSIQADVLALHGTLQLYESMKEEKRRERALLEKQLEEDQRLQAQLANKSASDKQHLLDLMAKDQNRLDGELAAIQNQKEKDRQLLVHALTEAERNSGQLVNQLLEMNEKARHTEELLEQMERERMEAEEWFVVRQEEAENLRKKEVIVAMERILAESATFNQMIENYLNTRDETARNYQNESHEMSQLLESMLDNKQLDQKELIAKLMTEEQLQKEAFEALQLQKDAKTQRITSQIELIQLELGQLTTLEVEQRDMRLDTQMNIIAERRVELTSLLVQLMQERDNREDQLKERLAEMENQKLDDQNDYWLIQYQRLMDRKPQSLMDQEKQLEFAVIEILERADAADYVPTFARHRISIETMTQMSEDDFKQMTIHEVGVRKSILREIARYNERSGEEEERTAAKLKGFQPPAKPGKEKTIIALPPEDRDDPPGGGASSSADSSPVDPTAPGLAPGASPAPGPGASPSPAPAEVTARGINTECVICMEQTSCMLLLNCGHVCMCEKCSSAVNQCPLCRGDILQRVRLMIARPSYSTQNSVTSQ